MKWIPLLVLLRVSIASAQDHDKVEAPARGSFTVDMLSPLQWGLHLTGEYSTGHVSLAASYRFIGMGIATQVLYAQTHEYVHPYFAMGFGLRGRYYFRPLASGPHVGCGVEYARVALDEEDYRHLGVGNYVIPSVQAGYRFGKKRFFFDPSVSIAPAFFVGESVWRRGSESADYSNGDDVAPIREKHFVGGEVKADLGVFF